jgi:predicted nucleic acid-binding protein
MTTAIDTNVLIALWRADDEMGLAAQNALTSGRALGGLSICAPVYAELLAFPTRQASFVESFLKDTAIYIDWEFTRDDWRDAGRAYQGFVARRKSRSTSQPRRILADFLIGAHAARRSHAFLTFDTSIYRSAFPTLKVVAP